MVTKSYIFYCFIEDTHSDFMEYFYTKEEGLEYIKYCIKFMDTNKIKYSRIHFYTKENPMIDIPCLDT